MINISVYDRISPTDSWPYMAMRYYVNDSVGGELIVLKQGSRIIEIATTVNDTPESIAQKIVAAWNGIVPNALNTVSPGTEINAANPVPLDTRIFQLITPQGDYQPFEFSFVDPSSIQTAIPEEKKSNWWWLLLLAGGVYLVTPKKKKQ